MCDYGGGHREELASRGKSSLEKLFAALRNDGDEEASFYWFIKKHEKRFTEYQHKHVHETLVLLRRESDVPEPAALAEPVASHADG